MENQQKNVSMSNGKVFSQETKDLIVKVADDVVKLPVYLEPFDAFAFKLVVNFIDDKLDELVPDEFDEFINIAINAALSGNLEEASQNIAQALNILVDIPYLEEEAEQEMFLAGAKFLTSMIKVWIEKKK